MTVAYFVGCAANHNDQEVGKATWEVLRHNGFEVIVPNQKCCGLPHLVSGSLERARRLAMFNVNSFLNTNCDIITACTSCALALKIEYPRLLKTEEAASVAGRSYDISEYLIRLHDLGEMKTDFHPFKYFGLYHAPCHLKALGEEQVKRRLRLMERVSGVRLEQLDVGCCGMAGLFGLKRDNYAISMEIGGSLFKAIRDRGPDHVITDCPACTMQIAHGSGITVSHSIQFWKKAYAL